MNIIVCVKRVPETAEAEIAIDASGKDIKAEDLVFDINEWDNYAVEEAVRLKPDNAQLHVQLGKALMKAGRKDEADVALREALRIRPDLPMARALLEESTNHEEPRSVK